MKNSKKHTLSEKATRGYFIDHISTGNSLSKNILSEVDFSKVAFFTILPENADLNKLYKFESGLIPSKERKKIDFLPGYYCAEKVEKTDKMLSLFIFDLLNENKGMGAVFEEVLYTSKSKDIDISGVRTCFYNKEIYYLVKSTCSYESVNKTIKTASSLWHFLAIVVENIGELGPDLKTQDFKDLCMNVKYVIVGAYDGEGYIIWERNGNQ